MPTDFSHLLDAEHDDRLEFAMRCRRVHNERSLLNPPAPPIVAIFDLDMTLSDHTHRVKHLNLKDIPNSDWPSYWKGAGKDAPLSETILMLKYLHTANIQIVIMTGRCVTTLSDTLLWFARYGIPFDDLYMRPENDFTPSHLLKKIWYSATFKQSTSYVFAVFDDRDSDVAMWREEGLQTYQVRPGNF